MVKKNGQMYVSSQFSKSGREIGDGVSEEYMIYVDSFETEPAEVSAELGMTVNLGNYESLRVTAGVRIPCYKEEIEQAQDFAFKLAEKKMFEIVSEVKGMV